MAPRIAYTKQAKSTPDLLAHLIGKGLAVRDQASALHSLDLIGYYRLLIYMRPLQDSQTNIFYPNAEFDDVMALYDFDRRLRLICLDAVERVEVALRAAITNVLAPDPNAGPHFYLDANHFISANGHASFMKAVCDPNTQKHQPVDHYLKTYHTPAHAPIWAILEAVTFGPLSHLYANLQIAHRKTIGQAFGFDEKILVTWFKSINLLRNVCAHHSRLWNKNNLVNAPLQAKALKAEFPAPADRGRVAARAVTLAALLEVIDPTSDWKRRFKSVVMSCPAGVLARAGLNESIMGFSPGWEQRAFWN
ncbi:Abi family protein [Pseudomonas violetae]|uniref:Abi family protein n=1 Tax=Pseudomonas violetae TaxID=2915813 RepID=A0ABT0ESB5_9PSED|nr:Abi family protein [Pseudomonas violetae]MCK1788616.1 Abi family protein [Pseudomonas violetae]